MVWSLGRDSEIPTHQDSPLFNPSELVEEMVVLLHTDAEVSDNLAEQGPDDHVRPVVWDDDGG